MRATILAMSSRALPKTVEAVADRRPLATIHNLAEYLNVPVRTIYGWRRRKSGDTGPKARKVGGQLRFDWRDIDEWLSQQESA